MHGSLPASSSGAGAAYSVSKDIWHIQYCEMTENFRNTSHMHIVRNMMSNKRLNISFLRAQIKHTPACSASGVCLSAPGDQKSTWPSFLLLKS